MDMHDASSTLPFYPLLKNATHMVSCKITLRSEDTQWYPRASSIKECLLANPHLEVLHLLSQDKLNYLRWDKGDMRKLPPVKELVIQGLHGWEIFSICDWSRISHLELINISSVVDIESIPLAALSRLKTLVIACECLDRAERQAKLQKLSDILCTLLSHTSEIKKLALKCGVCDFLHNRRGCTLTYSSEERCNLGNFVETIARNCQRLQSLELRSFDGLKFLPWRWIMLSATDLKLIRCSCSSLMELSLDVKTYLYGCNPRLDMSVTAALATLRNLRRVIVHTLMPYSRTEAGLLPHHRARAVAREWVENLRRLKQGVGFERLTMEVEIERLGREDEFQWVYPEDDWRVYLTYTFDAINGVSWSVTGEERSVEFFRK